MGFMVSLLPYHDFFICLSLSKNGDISLLLNFFGEPGEKLVRSFAIGYEVFPAGILSL